MHSAYAYTMKNLSSQSVTFRTLQAFADARQLVKDAQFQEFLLADLKLPSEILAQRKVIADAYECAAQATQDVLTNLELLSCPDTAARKQVELQRLHEKASSFRAEARR